MKRFGYELETLAKQLQPGNVENTHADISQLQQDTGYTPRVSIEPKFVAW